MGGKKIFDSSSGSNISRAVFSGCYLGIGLKTRFFWCRSDISKAYQKKRVFRPIPK